MTNNEAAKWIQLYIALAKIDPITGEAAYLNDDARKTIEAMEMAINALTTQPETHDKRTEMHACDLIDRQKAIDAYGDWYVEEGTENGFIGTVKQLLEGLPSAQPPARCIAEIKIDKDELAELVAKSMTKITEPDLQQTCNNLATDCISRKAAIDACHDYEDGEGAYAYGFIVEERLRNLPSAQPEPPEPEELDFAQPHKKVGVLLEIGQPEIIRCKECKHQIKEWRTDKRRKDNGYMVCGCEVVGDACGYWALLGQDDDYCSMAERRTDG